MSDQNQKLYPGNFQQISNWGLGNNGTAPNSTTFSSPQDALAYPPNWPYGATQSKPNVLNIDNYKKYVEKEMSVYENIKKEQDIINNLHPGTLKVLNVAYELSRSYNIEDVNKLDSVIRELIFNTKMEKIANE